MKEKQEETSGSVLHESEIEKAGVYFRQQVKHPGLFICLDKAEEWNAAETFIRKVQKEFPEMRALVYYTRGNPVPKPVSAHLLVADKKDFTLFGKEKKPLKQWLSENGFDLLLVVAKTNDARCRKLAGTIKAKLKVGNTPERETSWTDISLETGGKPINYDDFYKDLKIYFKQLNIKLLP